MKTSAEMVNSLLERRDAYVARQKQKRQLVMKVTSIACALVLVALVGVGVWQGAPADTTPMVDAPQTTTPTTAPTKDTGIGGDSDSCKIHNYVYHGIHGTYPQEDVDAFFESIGGVYGTEENNIVNFVAYIGYTREEVMMYEGVTEENWDEIADFGTGCPFTFGQYVDAICGENPELTEWVFSYDAWIFPGEVESTEE